MLTAGTVLDEQFIVSQPPERNAVGARFEVTDGAGRTRTALVAALNAEAWAVSLADNELKTLASQGSPAHLAFAERVVAGPDGSAIEILARGGFDDAEDYATGLSVQQAPGRVVGMLAARFVQLGEDLAVLHARGEIHGGIDSHAILVDPQATPQFVLALFARSRLVQPPPATPPDASSDARALADAFHALVTASRAPIDPTLAADVHALAQPNSDGSMRNLSELVEAWRALASRLGVSPVSAPSFAATPSAQQPVAPGVAAPAFTSGTNSNNNDGAYRPPPPSNDPFAGRSPGVHLPVRPDDGGGFRMGGRAIGLVVGVLLAIVRIAARSSSHSYGGYSSGYNSYNNNYYDPSRYRHTADPSDDSSRCEGESITPVSAAVIPGAGEVNQLAGACDGVMIRTAVQRGSDLYLPTRSGTTGMEWSALTESDRIATGVDDLSSSAPSESGAPFVAYTTQQSASIGLLALEDNARPVVTAIPGEHADTPPYALGQTARFTYVAARLIPEGRRTGTLALMRFSNPTAVDENGERTTQPVTLTVFDLGNYFPKAVIADEEEPRLLVAEFDANRPGRVRMLTLDLERFDDATVPAQARGHRRAPARGITLSGPLALQHPIAIAAPTGLANNTFLIASADASLAGADECTGQMTNGLCLEMHDIREAYFPDEGDPSLGPVIAERGMPLAVWSGIDGDEALVGTSTVGSVSRIVRYRLGADRDVARQGAFDVPRGTPRIDGFVQLACGGHSWMLFAGQVAGEARVSGVPSSCTSIGIDTSGLRGAGRETDRATDATSDTSSDTSLEGDTTGSARPDPNAFLHTR